MLRIQPWWYIRRLKFPSKFNIHHLRGKTSCVHCSVSMMTSSNEKISALLAICAGNSPVPGEFLAQKPVTRSFDVFFDLHLNQRLSKQSWAWWFETLPCPLWRHCNDYRLHGHIAVLKIQYIPRNMHTFFALLCFVVVIHWLIFPYPSGLLHWHCGNLTIAPVPAKQPWWIWINTSREFIMNDCITATKQSTTKPCAYFLGYTVWTRKSIFHHDGAIARTHFPSYRCL